MRNTKTKNTSLSFRIGKETFAVSVQKVLEVLERQYITKVPNVPKYVEGVINFRGKILPVIDTRLKFNLPKRNEYEKYVIIVFDIQVEEKTMLIGALADSVHDVITINKSDVQPVPEMGYNYDTEYLIGMFKNETSFTMILDIDKVFSKVELDLLKTEVINTCEEADIKELLE